MEIERAGIQAPAQRADCFGAEENHVNIGALHFGAIAVIVILQDVLSGDCT